MEMYSASFSLSLTLPYVINNPFPSDVHWVWHCHMLCPSLYAADLEASVLGRAIDHNPRDAATLEDLRRKTERRWEEAFPEEPFDFQPPTQEVFNSDFKYDILAAALRQMEFFYQVEIKLSGKKMKCFHSVLFTGVPAPLQDGLLPH